MIQWLIKIVEMFSSTAYLGKYIMSYVNKQAKKKKEKETRFTLTLFSGHICHSDEIQG